jgi:hypothetical protein
MTGLHHYFPRSLIPILFLVSVFVGSAAAQKRGDCDNTANWQTYSNPRSNFTFTYPKGWEITDDFFYKTHWSVNLQKVVEEKGSNNWIRINSPQFQDEDETCTKVGKEHICTYSRDPDVLEIYKKLTVSFKVVLKD